MEEKLEILNQLYSELRAYRNKEFQTFIFTVPIVGAGFLPEFDGKRGVEIALILFSLCMLNYIWRNHMRMLLIKKEIVNFQKLVGVNDLFRHLAPEKWVTKSHWDHLGTVWFSIILVSEAILIIN